MMSVFFRRLALSFAAFLPFAPLFAGDDGAKKEPALKGAAVLMVIAPKDFRDEELFVPKAAFEAEGAAVTVASTTTEECVGMLGGTARPTLLLKDAKADDYAAVVFVGGFGVTGLFENPEAQALAQAAAKGEKTVLAAICLAPVLLAKAGALKDKSATVWDDEKKTFSAILTANGATYKAETVVEDGRTVTGNGPDAASAFAAAIVKRMTALRPAPAA